MSVDAFLRPYSLEKIDVHRAGIMSIARELNLSPTTDIAIGSGGLALHGLDAHYRSDITDTPYTHFDGDFVVSPDIVWETVKRYPRATIKRDSLILEAEYGRPRATLLAGQLPKEIAAGLEATTSEQVAKGGVIIEGVGTLPAHRLAKAKLNAGRIQDVGGVLQAHAVAFATHHDVLRDAHWWGEVSRAVSMAQSQEYRGGGPFSKIKVAPWLSGLIKSDFNHPAFSPVRSDTHRRAA